MEIPDDLIADLIPAVQAQISAKQPPCVAATFARLTQEGLTESDACELIAQALAVVANDMMLCGKPFDLKAYQKLLKALPQLPDESTGTPR